MNKLKTILGGLAITCAGIFGLNFGVNVYKAPSVRNKLNSLKKYSVNAEEYKSCNSNIEDLLTKIENTEVSTGDLFKPFWSLNNLSKKIDNYHINLNNLIWNYVERTIDIGIGADWGVNYSLVKAVNSANLLLAKHKIHLKIGEKIELDMPELFDSEELVYGIKHSFSKPHDYYFAISHFQDYSYENDDFAVKALTESRVCFIDSDFQEENLEELVSQEILRLFSDAKNTNFYKNIDYYSIGVSEEKIKKNIFKTFNEKPYNITPDIFQRVITVNIGLDNVSEDMANYLLEQASKVYEKNFGIKFKAVDLYEYKLPKAWNTFKQMKKIKNKAKQSSDLYLMFTNTNWGQNSDGEGYSIAGEANPYYGYSWIEVYNDLDRVIHTLVHELAHLFKAEHVYLRNALMHPYNNNKVNFTPATKHFILTNKYQKWEWSD